MNILNFLYRLPAADLTITDSSYQKDEKEQQVLVRRSSDEDANVTVRSIQDFRITTLRLYQEFRQNPGNMTLLTDANNILRRATAGYADLMRFDPEMAEVNRYQVVAMRNLVTQMHTSCPRLMPLHLDMIQDFFTTPIEKFFIDPDTGIRYVQPDHSQVLNLGIQYFEADMYASIGFSREEKLDGRVCDVLFMTKFPDQIAFETPSKKKHFPMRAYEWLCKKKIEAKQKKITDRISRQIDCLERVNKELQAKHKLWKYKSFKPCATKELTHLGMEPKKANLYHALVFFYKKSNV